jgi:hypothetical protein
MTAEPPVREARLRSEFAELYPGVEPGVWYTAATLAEHLLSRLVRQDGADATVPDRILDDIHFEFRGEPGLKGGRIILGG